MDQKFEGSNPKGYLSTPGPDRNGEHMMGVCERAQSFSRAISRLHPASAARERTGAL